MICLLHPGAPAQRLAPLSQSPAPGAAPSPRPCALPHAPQALRPPHPTPGPAPSHIPPQALHPAPNAPGPAPSPPSPCALPPTQALRPLSFAPKLPRRRLPSPGRSDFCGGKDCAFSSLPTFPRAQSLSASPFLLPLLARQYQGAENTVGTPSHSGCPEPRAAHPLVSTEILSSTFGSGLNRIKLLFLKIRPRAERGPSGQEATHVAASAGAHSCPPQVPAPQGISAPTSRPAASSGQGRGGEGLLLWGLLAKLLQSHPVQGREGSNGNPQAHCSVA